MHSIRVFCETAPFLGFPPGWEPGCRVAALFGVIDYFPLWEMYMLEYWRLHHRWRGFTTCRLVAFLALTLFCLGHEALRAGDGESVEVGVDDATDDVEFITLARDFRKHCARVYIYGKSYAGDFPSVGDVGDDIRHERPTPVGGYWWDDHHVIIPDLVLQDRFIRSIEIGVPGTDAVYPARVAGRFVKLQAVLLEVLEDGGGVLPAAAPIEFIDGDIEDAVALSYVWHEGEWRVKADSALGASSLSDSDIEFVALSAQGVIIDAHGHALGLAFGDKAMIGDDSEPLYWYGRELGYSPFVGTEETRVFDTAIGEKLSKSVLECRFNIRVKVDEDDEDDPEAWNLDTIDDGQGQNSAEVGASAFVVGRRHLFVPVDLSPEGIRRIEGIAVVLPGGRELEATFVGAFKKYMAVFVEVGEDLPVDSAPDGFARLNPFAAPQTASKPMRQPLMEYLRRWRIDYDLGRRREVVDYDRWLGTFTGYRGDTIVLTKTNEHDGCLAFDVDGNLAAIALTPRVLKSRDPVKRIVLKAAPAFRPLDFVQRQFLAADVFDPALKPVDEDQGQRLIDFGVEFQSLDANTARLFNASNETRGGNIGVMVSHVYSGSMADKAGIRDKDILVRLFFEGRAEPMELRASDFSFGFDMDISSDMFRSMWRFMPPPWPSRENVVTTLLTAAGVGRKASIEYIRDGKSRRVDFVTSYYEPDYRSARKAKFSGLGLTVKPVTYEVARYFRRDGDDGVVISNVETGGKGSVSGLRNYLLLTRVDGRAVEGLDDFRNKVQAFEDGEAASIEMTVEDFGKTRLIKIE